MFPIDRQICVNLNPLTSGGELFNCTCIEGYEHDLPSLNVCIDIDECLVGGMRSYTQLPLVRPLLRRPTMEAAPSRPTASICPEHTDANAWVGPPPRLTHHSEHYTDSKLDGTVCLDKCGVVDGPETSDIDGDGWSSFDLNN